jgi:hypothetical protein
MSCDPHVVKHYRAAREIAHRARTGQASTEDLRRALVHYRTLFENLLEVQDAGVAVAPNDAHVPQASPSGHL